MRTKWIVIILILVLTVASIGCSSNIKTKTAGENGDKALTGANSVSAKEDVAFSVNGQYISATDFRKRLYKARFVQEAQGVRYDGSNKEMYNELRDHTVQLMVKETIVMQEAKKIGVSVPESEVEKVIAGIRSRFPSEEDFKATMKSRGLDVDTIKAYNRMQLTSVALMQKLGGRQQYDDYINNAIAKAKIEKNGQVISDIVDEISLISTQQLLASPGNAI